VGDSINYKIPLDTTRFSDGTHTLTITAVDREGNMTTQSLPLAIKNKESLSATQTPSSSSETSPTLEVVKKDRTVIVTAENHLRVRETPGGNVIGYQTKGTSGTVTEGPVSHGGYTWWKVSFSQGTSGWTAENYLKEKGSESNTYSFTRTLKVGSRGDDVKALQIILNKDPRTKVSNTGAGSPGNESTYFGAKTKAAVIKYQELYKEKILAPNNLLRGTGIVGSATRKVLEGL
jgi:hypothetical protein